MTREEILNAAKAIVCQGREVEYGAPEVNFKLIADFWSLYLTTKTDKALTSEDVAVMMSLMKIARIATGRYKDDNWIDLVGYAACGGEAASRARTPVPEPTPPEPKRGRHSYDCVERAPCCLCNRCQHDTDEGDSCCNVAPYERGCFSTYPCPNFKEDEA